MNAVAHVFALVVIAVAAAVLASAVLAGHRHGLERLERAGLR